ncbi:uncharacterized protein LOC143469838 [Clavelina lepadiformis]|uniref:uncharacterized protein LOC143469838 n=1 Tax=Clavelina lepadiformis TaxID=159417 RepID=UPI004042E403
MLPLNEKSSSILKRLRNTPKTLRRKLKLSHDNNDTTKLDLKPAASVEAESLRKLSSNKNQVFNCRYIGQRTVYTLKPEDCYDFAVTLINTMEEKPSFKTTISVESKAVEVLHLPVAPVNESARSKLAAAVSSPLFTKKNLDRHRAQRPLSEYTTCTATTVFDQQLCKTRPNSADVETMFSTISSDEFDRMTNRSQTHNSSYAKSEIETMEVAANKTKILLHEIAYCVTVPEQPRVFLLTSRGRGCLTCRVFLFFSKDKAQALKLTLAKQFQISFEEWIVRQMRRSRRESLKTQSIQVDRFQLSNDNTNTSLKITNLENHQDQASSGSMEVILDDESDEMLSEEEEAMNREFIRRASCLPNPERLAIGQESINDEMVHHLQKIFENSDMSSPPN